MSRAELKERAQKRLAKIAETQDSGVYAKHYVEDVTALLKVLEYDEELIERRDKHIEQLSKGDP